jgi:hypothetical protein
MQLPSTLSSYPSVQAKQMVDCESQSLQLSGQDSAIESKAISQIIFIDIINFFFLFDWPTI